MGYTNALSRNANLEIDVVFTLRVPLWPIQIRDSHPVGSFRARDIRVLDIHELAAGKLSALFTRRASRDLFDAHALEDREREFLVQVIEKGNIAPELLTGDDELATRIRQHPQLLWKVKHVREHRGLRNE